MNDFDKTFLLAFNNYFLKIELNLDKESILILNTCSFQKKMLPNLTRPLIKSLMISVLQEGFKDNSVLKIL